MDGSDDFSLVMIVVTCAFWFHSHHIALPVLQCRRFRFLLGFTINNALIVCNSGIWRRQHTARVRFTVFVFPKPVLNVKEEGEGEDEALGKAVAGRYFLVCSRGAAVTYVKTLSQTFSCILKRLYLFFWTFFILIGCRGMNFTWIFTTAIFHWGRSGETSILGLKSHILLTCAEGARFPMYSCSRSNFVISGCTWQEEGF